MSVRSAQSVTILFTTRVFSTGVGTNADSLPTGTLYVNGVANGATVTVANVSTGLYTAQVTLPTLAVGDEVEIAIAATVSSVSDKAVIWGDTKDVFAGAIPDAAANSNGGLPILSVSGTTLGYTVTTLTTYTGNTPQTGDNYARLGAPAGASVSADVAAIKSETDTILTDVNTGAGAIYTRIGAPVGASIAADVAGCSHPATAQTINLTTALSSSPTQGTIGDALLAAEAQGFGKWTISGTTLTIYRHDGTTVARTFSLDSSSAPTSRT